MTIAVTAGVLAPSAALAQQDGNADERRRQREGMRELREPRREPMRERLENADRDHDRALNRTEAQRNFPRLHRRFDDIDANRDGAITPDEVRTYRRSRARQRMLEDAGPDPRN